MQAMDIDHTPAKSIRTIYPDHYTIPKITRVCAYFRVSTAHKGQQNSFQNQVRIKVRYLPTDLATAYLYNADGQCEGQIHLVRKVDNSRIRRQNTIDYTRAGGEANV